MKKTGIKYNYLTLYLLMGLQELNKTQTEKINKLESENQLMKNEIENLNNWKNYLKGVVMDLENKYNDLLNKVNLLMWKL